MNFPAAGKHNSILSFTAIGVIAAILASVAEALYTPLTKLISADAGLMMSVSFIFFGSAFGMLIVLLFGRKSKAVFDPKRHLRKKDTGILLAIILVSMAVFTAEIIGFQLETAATSSILQNVGTVATVLFAALFLKEKIPKRLGVGVALIVLGSLALAVTNPETLSFSTGSLIIIGACLLVGVIYILLKLLSERNPIEITIIRGLIIGAAALVTAFCMGESLPSLPHALGLMVTGFVACGLCPLFLMYAQRYLGAARAGAIYGIYPLLGVLFAIPILGEIPSAAFLAALILFIPGMYFVITKNTGTEAAKKEEDVGEHGERDTQFFTSISDSRKTDLRNHVTSFGLLIIALFFVMMMLDIFDSGTAGAAADALSSSFYLPGAILGIFILLAGIVLLILGKRAMAAVTFILMAPQMFSTAILGEMPMMNILSGLFFLIFALILMTARDKQKYAFASINILLGVVTIIRGFDNAFCGFIMAAAAVYLIWLSVACGTGKLRYSISKYLSRDGEMTFRRCGSVIGYLLLAKYLVIIFIYEYIDPTFSSAPASLDTLGNIHICLLVFVGLMLLFIGKRRVTSTFFIGFGLALALDLTTSDTFGYLPVILLLVLGIQNVLRRDPRILPSFLLIGEAFAIMLYNQLVLTPEVQTAMLLLTVGCTAIALYLSFAVFAEKPKLPLF